MDVRNKKNHSIGFGFVGATFTNKSFRALPEKTQIELTEMLVDGLRFPKSKDHVVISAKHPNKAVISSAQSGMTAVQFQHKKPIEEINFLKKNY